MTARPTSIASAALALLAVIPHPSRAQRSGYTAIRDSLATVTDSVYLRSLASPGSTPSFRVSAGMVRGLAGMRLFELTGIGEHARRARQAFEDETRRDPDNPWAWYGLGLTWAEGPELRAGPPTFVAGRAFAEALGLDAGSRAVRAMRHALELDPRLIDAARSIVPLAIEKHDREALEKARATLALAEREGRFSVDALLALATAESALGNAGLAVLAATRASTMTGRAPQSRYTLATTLFAAGRDEEGAGNWFGAIEDLTPDLAGRYLEDLRPIADEIEIEQWERADLDGRRQWLREFWDSRAALGGVSIEQRIGEHYRRLAVARQQYYRRRRWGAPPTNALLLRRPDLPFDDRGIIYVRHGEPFDVIRSAGPSFADMESWAYRLPDGTFRLLNFVSYGSAVRDVGAAGNPLASSTAGALGDAYREYLLVYNLPCNLADDRRALYDRRLGLLRCNEFDQRAISAEVRRDAYAALRSDSDSPDFSRDLPFAFDLYTFRGRDGLTDVTAAVLIPGDSLTPAPAFRGVAWDLDVSLILADTTGDRVTRADTMLRLVRPAPVESGDWLRLHLTVPVRPGPALAQRIVVRETADPGHGQLYGRGFDVPDYSGPDLMLSDILLASPDSGGTFHRGRHAFALMPTRQFAGGTFRAFYEIYNLTPDATYETELVVEKAGGGIGGFLRGLFGGGPIIRLRFDGVASPNQGLSAEVRRVDTSLGPGDYRIRVRVTDLASGRIAEREREFTVVR